VEQKTSSGDNRGCLYVVIGAAGATLLSSVLWSSADREAILPELRECADRHGTETEEYRKCTQRIPGKELHIHIGDSEGITIYPPYPRTSYSLD
jgi:hypothetical protein